MAEIVQISTIERRLFQPDTVPMTFLMTQSTLQELRQRYGFAQLVPQPSPENPSTFQVVGSAGEFVFQQTRFTLQELSLSQNLIQVQVNGESQVADSVFMDLGDFLRKIDPNRNFSEGRQDARTYQTIAVARMSFSADSLVSENLRTYLQQTVQPRLNFPDAEAVLRLANLSWHVQYNAKTTERSYIPKLFTIEPRTGSKPSDRLFFTQSPTDSAMHKELLAELERVLTRE
jgi:hypothetical protein